MIRKLIALFKWMFFEPVCPEPEIEETPTPIRVVRNIKVKCVDKKTTSTNPEPIVDPEPPRRREMTYAEWKSQNKKIDAYFNMKYNKPNLRLVA